MIPWLIVLATLAREQTLNAQKATLAEAGTSAVGVQIVLKGASPEILCATSIRFPWAGLTMPAAPGADTVMMWRGEATDLDGRVRSVWARVQIKAPRRGVVAARPISAGRRLTMEDLRMAEWNGPLTQAAPVEDPGTLAGKVLTRSLSAGAPILEAIVMRTDQILPGERILVESIAGTARIRFDATAENRAGIGERVYFRSPLNGRRVAGRAEAGHRVVLGGEI